MTQRRAVDRGGRAPSAPEIAVALAAAGERAVPAGTPAERAEAARARAVGLGGGGDAIAAAAIGPDALAGAELVIESIVEGHGAKRELFDRVEAWCSPDAVVAANTSSLGSRAGGGARRPGRFAGLHFPRARPT